MFKGVYCCRVYITKTWKQSNIYMIKEVVLPPYNGHRILSIKKLMSIDISIKIYY